MLPRFVILTTMVALLAAGCVAPQASNEEGVEVQQAHFYVFLKPKEHVGSISDVMISESKGKIIVRTDDREKSLQAQGEYAALKRLILESPEWNAHAKEPYYQTPWHGPPRDILDVRQEDKGMRLQGERVPPEWSKRILALLR